LSYAAASLMSEGELNKRSELQVSWLKANNVANPFKYTVEEVALAPIS